MQLALRTDRKEIRDLAKALSSDLRIEILIRLSMRETTVRSLHEQIGRVKYRDTIYRQVEALRKARIVKKYYDQEAKELKYALADDRIIILLSEYAANLSRQKL